MTAWVWADCVRCHKQFRQGTGAGRRRVYCDAACRRRAQRERDAGKRRRGQSEHRWGPQMMEDVHERTARLLDAEQQALPLAGRLRAARRLHEAVDRYTDAAVRDAHADGLPWAGVALAAGVAPETARGRWAGERVRARMRRWRDGTRPVPGPGVGARRLAQVTGHGRRLAAALSTLQRRSGVAVTAAAAQARCSTFYLNRVLSGEQTPSWSLVYLLCCIFQGKPEEFHLLWEYAQGVAPQPRPSVAQAAERVTDAVRGQYLAAGEPAVQDVCAQEQCLVAEEVEAVLNGDLIPDWPQLSALVRALGGAPAALRPCWEHLHYAVLCSTVPQHGSARDGGPAEGTA